MPFVRRTLAIFRRAELGFFGVVVETLTQTPRLKGEEKNTGLFFRTLNPRVNATVLSFGWALTLGLLINWLIVGICCLIYKQNSTQLDLGTTGQYTI